MQAMNLNDLNPHALRDPRLFVETMERYGITPKKLGISTRYKLMLKRGERRPSEDLIQRLINAVKEKLSGVEPPAGFEPATTGLQGRQEWNSAHQFNGINGSMPLWNQFHASSIPAVGNHHHNPFVMVNYDNVIDEFLEWAKAKYSKKTFESEIKVYVKYVKLLAMPSILATELEKLSTTTKKHVLKTLSIFARFLDIKYATDEFTAAFQRVRKAIGLKWYTPKQPPRIAERLEDPADIAARIIRNIRCRKHRLFALFMLATGFRTSEAIDAWENFTSYYKEIDGIRMLEVMHERKTKKCYFGFIPPKLAEIMKHLRASDRRIDDAWVWKSWREACAKAGVDHRAYPLYFLRKVNATLLRRRLDSDQVDLLQGRAPKKVLDQYYNVESLKYLYQSYMETVGKFVEDLIAECLGTSTLEQRRAETSSLYQ